MSSYAKIIIHLFGVVNMFIDTSKNNVLFLKWIVEITKILILASSKKYLVDYLNATSFYQYML
jgi:hypothetical protein